MPLTRQPPHQSIEGDLRSVYRALGMSELTMERTIRYSKIGPDSKIGSDENPSPDAKRRRGRPRRNVRLLGQA
jgi:hypothetical protein